MRIKTLTLAALFTLSGAALASAQQCPALGSTGAVVEVDGSQLNRGIRTEVIAGTQIDAWDCQRFYMVGYVNVAPTLTMRLSNAGSRGVEVIAESDCDPTLLIETPNGQIAFDDDNYDIGRGLDPAIPLPAMGDGTYNIWVGSYRNSYCLTTLRIRYR
ncbi:hypothetical protein [Gymnodinialimonas ulvae]|uniref:hypothetical protein n=1 Tax=Gymnodinialimonas ulvae TaxID=3126504 RepID=UPI0030AA75F6